MWLRRHPVLAGIAGGFVWGLVLRLWMRFISHHPEFSWSGTLFIIGAATMAGAVLGVAWWRRESGGRGWWRLLGFATLPVFGGAGVIMLPSALLGAVALGRPQWWRPVRGVLLLVALGLQAALVGAGGEGFPAGRAVPALAWYAVMITLQMWALSIVFSPNRSSDAAESRMRSRRSTPDLAVSGHARRVPR